MRLLRLALRHFRGIDQREIVFAPTGITFVTGPNEVGKSSFGEALDLLFDEVDSTRKQSVAAVKPAHRDEGSEIEAEIEVGPYAFTYAKRFHRSPYTRLRVTRPEVENHTGREAHDRVQEILDACIDTDLWKALRVQQGQSLEQEALGDSAGLAAALDAAAGLSTEGDRERSLLEAAERERNRYFTPGGREKVEVRRARERAEEAALAAQRGEERLAQLEDALVREAACSAEIAEATVEDRACEETLRRSEAEHEALSKLRESARASEAARELALVEEREALAQWRQRGQLLASHAAAEGELASLEQALEESGPPLLAARGELEHASEVERSARAAFEAACGVEATRSKDLEYHRGRTEHTALAARIERIEAAEAERGLARSERQRLPDLAAAQVDAIRDAELAVETARARLEAEGPRVRLEAERDLELEMDGRTLRVAAGESLEQRLAEFLSLSLPGVGQLSVVAGAGAAERRKRLEEAETSLRGLCAEAGVDDHAGAVLVLEKRRDAERRMREADERLADALAGAEAEALRSRANRLAERIAHYPDERPADVELAPDLDAAGAGLEGAAEAVRKARAALDEASSRLEAVAQRARRLEDERRDTELRHGLGRESALDLRARLDAAREEVADDTLSRASEAASTAAREAEQTHRDDARALSDADPDRVDAALDAASRARTKAARRLADAREAQREVRGLIAGHGESGLHEELEALHARALESGRESESLSRRAAAAKLLFDTLSEERESARSGYADPLRRHIESLGRSLFGADFAVTLDEDLQVVRRQHAGIDLPEPDLSTGAREQLAILQRLAMALAVAEPEGMPVMIDDALGHADPARRSAMLRLLEQVGERCQIIVLSCDPARYEELTSARVVTLE